MNRSQFIEPFQMSELFIVAGQQGLWRIKSMNRMMGISIVSRLSNPKQTVHARFQDLTHVPSVRIPTKYVERKSKVDGFTDPDITMLPDVFENMWILYNGMLPIFLDAFDNIDRDEQISTIMDAIPDADMIPNDKFPELTISYFSKIIKWYADLIAAMSMVDSTEDPYDLLTPKDYENN